MGILINTGFDLGSGSPLDNRTLKDTIAERDALVTEGKVHENLKVYCKDTQTEYRWTGTEWEEVGTGGTVDLSEYTKTYTSLTQLGLTAPVTVGEIFNAMPNKTMAVLSCEAKDESVGTVTVSDIPESYGVLTIKKNGVGRLSIEYQNSSYNTACDVKRWIGTLKGADGTGLVWKQLSAEPTFTTLSDIGLTADATFQDVVDVLPKGGSALLGVKNFTNYQTIFPYEEGNDQFARVYIVKGIEDGSNVYARWFRKDGVKEAIANFNISDNKFNGWVKTPSDTRITTVETQVNELFQNAPNLATKEYVDSKLGKESINDSITSTTDVWSSSKTKSYVDAASNKPVTTIAGGGKSVDTGWNLKCGTKYNFGKVLLINAYNDAYSGTTGTGSCLLFVMGDFNTAKITTATICKTGIDISKFYSLEVSSSGTLVIKTTTDLATSNDGKGKAKLSFVFLN